MLFGVVLREGQQLGHHVDHVGRRRPSLGVPVLYSPDRDPEAASQLGLADLVLFT